MTHLLQGISANKIMQIRKEKLTPSLVTYYKDPLVVHQVAIKHEILHLTRTQCWQSINLFMFHPFRVICNGCMISMDGDFLIFSVESWQLVQDIVIRESKWLICSYITIIISKEITFTSGQFAEKRLKYQRSLMSFITHLQSCNSRCYRTNEEVMAYY